MLNNKKLLLFLVSFFIFKASIIQAMELDAKATQKNNCAHLITALLAMDTAQVDYALQSDLGPINSVLFTGHNILPGSLSLSHAYIYCLRYKRPLTYGNIDTPEKTLSYNAQAPIVLRLLLRRDVNFYSQGNFQEEILGWFKELDAKKRRDKNYKPYHQSHIQETLLAQKVLAALYEEGNLTYINLPTYFSYFPIFSSINKIANELDLEQVDGKIEKCLKYDFVLHLNNFLKRQPINVLTAQHLQQALHYHHTDAAKLLYLYSIIITGLQRPFKKIQGFEVPIIHLPKEITYRIAQYTDVLATIHEKRNELLPIKKTTDKIT